MAAATIAANSESSNVTPSSGGKRLVKSKSGLKIVCQHDRESAPWDMAEPQWTPDKEVTYFVTTSKSSFLFLFQQILLKISNINLLPCKVKLITNR